MRRDNVAIFREIVTKAVIGKGRKYFKDNYTITPETKTSTVLGCWIMNHEFCGSEKDGKVVVDGVFDIHLWYAYDDDTNTAIYHKKQKYTKTVRITIKTDSNLTNQTEIIVRALKQPTCVKANVCGDNIELEIEQELGIELVGDTKIQVPIGSEDETWEIIQDDSEVENIDKQIDDSVKKDFIK